MRARRTILLVAVAIGVGAGCTGVSPAAGTGVATAGSTASPGTVSPGTTASVATETSLASASPVTTPSPVPTPSPATPSPPETPPPLPTSSPEATATPLETVAPSEPATTPSATAARTLGPGESAPPTPMDISAFLTATVAIVNLADEPVEVGVDYVDETTGQTGTVAEVPVTPFGLLSQDVPAGMFAFRFERAEGAPGETCVLEIADGAAFEFTVLPASVLVLRADDLPETLDAATVGTSPLCREGAP